MKIVKKVLKKIVLIGIGIYVISIFISQQQLLNTYQKEIGKYETQKEEAEAWLTEHLNQQITLELEGSEYTEVPVK